MNYRVYNEKNWSERMGTYFHTYFKTKREAWLTLKEIGGNAVEKKGCNNMGGLLSHPTT